MTPTQLRNLVANISAPILRRIKQLLQRSVLLRTTYSGNVRLLQVKVPGGSALADLEHLEPFGYTGHAPDGAEAIVLALGGNSSHSIVLLVGDRRYRLKIEKGEMAIYNQWHDVVHIKNDRSIHAKAALKVLLETPLVECTENLKVTGNVEIGGNQTIAGTSTAADHISSGISGKDHLHSGVTPGGSDTGAPVGGGE